MKKLVFMAAVVCAAVSAQAAKVYWSASSIQDFVDKDTQSPSTVEDGKDVTVYYTKGKTSGTTSAETLNNAFTSQLSNNLTSGDWTVYYKVVWGKREFTSDSMTINVVSGKPADTEYHSLATTGVWVDNAADPTPEPTSGLLVLIGMGALALKRKRA